VAMMPIRNSVKAACEIGTIRIVSPIAAWL
jgi:hypothetical protein